MEMRTTAIFKAHSLAKRAENERRQKRIMFWSFAVIAMIGAVGVLIISDRVGKGPLEFGRLAILGLVIVMTLFTTWLAYTTNDGPLEIEQEIIEDITQLDSILGFIPAGSLPRADLENVKLRAEHCMTSLIIQHANGERADQQEAERKYSLIREFNLVEAETYDEYFGY